MELSNKADKLVCSCSTQQRASLCAYMQMLTKYRKSKENAMTSEKECMAKC